MRPYILEIRYEFLSLLRMPRFAVPTLLLPPMFYVFFGLIMPVGRFTSAAAKTLLAGYCVFGVLCAALWGIGAITAAERGLGWLEVKRASPMPQFSYITAKLATAILFGFIIQCTLMALAVFAGGLHLEPAQILQLTLLTSAAAIPFGALGFLVGAVASPQSAPGMINLLAFPLAILSGLWLPAEALPAGVRQIAPVLPPYHVVEVALAILGRRSGEETGMHLAVLAGMTVLLLGAAAVAWRRHSAR